MVQSYTYDDGCEPCGTDTFMREPFVVLFSPTKAGEVCEINCLIQPSTEEAKFLFMKVLNQSRSSERNVNFVFTILYHNGENKSSGLNPTLNSFINLVFLFLLHSPVCLPDGRGFALIPQHTSPDSAVKEVDALYDVVADVRNRWGINVNPFIHSLHSFTVKCKKLHSV